MRPIIKVGQDLSGPANTLLEGIPRLDLTGMVVTSEPNNRVELRYHSNADRTEHLTGGVHEWGWAELAPRVSDVDALLVNFISGSEMTLETAMRLRRGFTGPMYADLHSLFLGRAEDGTRVPQGLPDYPRWASCFDIVQMNEDEAMLAADSVRASRAAHGADTAADTPTDVSVEAASIGRVLSTALGAGARLAAVTRGARGVSWQAAGPLPPDPLSWPARGAGEGEARSAARSVTIRPRREGDPTGCGDVWGAAMFGRLLAGEGPEASIHTANRLAGRNMDHQGAEGLYEILRNEVKS